MKDYSLLNFFLPKSLKTYQTKIRFLESDQGSNLKRIIDGLLDEYGLPYESHTTSHTWLLQQLYASRTGQGKATGSYFCNTSPAKMKRGVDATFTYVGVDKSLVERIEDALECTGCFKVL